MTLVVAAAVQVEMMAKGKLGRKDLTFFYLLLGSLWISPMFGDSHTTATKMEAVCAKKPN